MASIDQPPEILGGLIGGALVGTFLGGVPVLRVRRPLLGPASRTWSRRITCSTGDDPRGAGGQPAQPRDQHLHRGRAPERAGPSEARFFTDLEDAAARAERRRWRREGGCTRFSGAGAVGTGADRGGADRSGAFGASMRGSAAWCSTSAPSVTGGSRARARAVASCWTRRWRAFATDGVFELIPRDRLAGLVAGEGLELRLACPCPVEATRYRRAIS